MRRLCLVILALAAVTPAAAPPRTKVFITSTAKTDKPAKKGEASSQAQASARAMENLIAQGMDGRFPCSSSMTPTDVGNLLGHERTRQLLGSGGDPATLSAIADSMNAPYLIHISVTDYGARRTVNISLLNARKAMATARYSKTIPIDSDAYEALEGIAEEFLNSLGEAFPKCPGPWRGTVKLERDFKEVVPGATFTYEGWLRQKTACTIESTGTRIAQCAAEYDAGEKKLCPNGRDCSHSSQGKGTTGVNITVEIDGGRLLVEIPSFSIKGENGVDTTIMGMTIREPATANPKEQSGSKSSQYVETKTSSGTWTMTWSFSRQ